MQHPILITIPPPELRSKKHVRGLADAVRRSWNGGPEIVGLEPPTPVEILELDPTGLRAQEVNGTTGGPADTHGVLGRVGQGGGGAEDG